jgi:DNA polymerase-3 subunit gamma/tau
MAEKLSVAVLTRAWQIALKGVGEAQAAPAALPAVEMVLIRLAHAAELPTPADIVRRLQGEGATAAAPASATPATPAAPSGSVNGPAATARAAAGPAASAMAAPVTTASGGSAGGGSAVQAAMSLPATRAEAAAAPEPAARPVGQPDPQSFRELVDLFGARKQGDLRNHLYMNVHLVAYKPGRLEFRPREAAPRDLTGQVLGCLRDWCGAHWSVTVSGGEGEATLADQDRDRIAAERAAAEQHPLVRAALAAFPGARIERVTALDGSDDDALLETEAAVPPDDEVSEDDELLIDTLDESSGDDGYADLDHGYAGPDDGDEYP